MPLIGALEAGDLPIIILLPGTDGTGLLFKRLLTELRSATLVIDYPVNELLTYEQLEKYVRERLPIDQSFIVVGESFSGPIAVALAADPPSGLSGIVLSASFASSPWPLASIWRRLVALMPSRPPAKLASFALMGSHATPELESDLERALCKVQAQVLRHRLRCALSVDFRPKLMRAKVPLLYLAGKRDRIIPNRCGLDVKRLAPDACVQSIDAPHFILQCQAKLSANVIEGFHNETVESF